ncbi:MAG: tRNA (adenosine(37)-N6)-dimethylallyltransferase MiaA, partial [Proteobacteria bacterium]|nr:tRNA (adenosine(37)-N6)-dimethylallyltransferase MiaA [Pseudomonadota bacterium]
MTSVSPYIMIAGPTASGKSQLAIDLARRFNGAVINADSMQLYADLAIVTARPQPQDLEDIPHHLFGICDAAHRASVAEWLGLAATAIADVRSAGQLPIIVGGTGMYLQAGLRGIAPVPDVPADLHQHCIDLYRQLGGAKFRDMLAGYDADIAARLVDGDSQRLIRAMGVAMATDRPLSWWQQQPHKGAFMGSVIKITMMPPRPTLYDRINQRFDHMLAHGAVDEVARLMARQLDPGLPLMKALGVAPIAAFLAGNMTKDDAAFIAKRDSRRYAKRQMTWIRNNFNAQITVEKKYSESLYEK